jgi:Raf kinase inhibitor-like YbhB/YbcL family protein
MLGRAGAAVVASCLAVACGGERMPTGMRVTSPAFAHKAPVPERFSCEGENVPPPLRWSRAPEGTAELAVVVEDPDARNDTFVHWLVVGIDPRTTALEPDGLPAGATVLPGSSDNRTYIGPCPPDGSGTHRYFFEVYALPRRPRLAERDRPLEKVRAIRRAASAGGYMIGTFTR